MKQREEIFMDVIVVDNVSDNFIMRRIHGFICNCIKTSLIVKGGFKLSFYGGLKLYDLVGLRTDRC